MTTSTWVRVTAILLFTNGSFHSPQSMAQVPVRYKEGLIHGFLVLRTLEGETIAEGDLMQIARGDRVTSHVLFHFKDGSTQEETTIFSQRGVFRVLSDQLQQKGPSFKQLLDLSIDTARSKVTVHYVEDGQEKTATEHMKLPPDLANGILPTLLKNTFPDTPPAALSMVVATPKPRLVKLAVSRAGQDSFSIAGSNRTATHYVVKVEVGGLAGLAAPLIGKEPPNTGVWIFGGEAPVCPRFEGPFYLGGPIWRIEPTSPVWPQKGVRSFSFKDAPSHSSMRSRSF